MNYFRKTKFRESSLIIVALFIAIVYFTTNTISIEQDKAVQEIIDARVEEAVEEALKEVTTTAVTLSQTEAYAQNNTLDQLVSTETWYLFDADPPKSNYPEDLRRIEVLQTKLSDIYPEVQITSIYDEQKYQYHEKYCKEYNITECSLPYISDEHSYVTTTLPQPLIPDFSNPKVNITNCPTEVINADFYELEWTVENEGSGVDFGHGPAQGSKTLKMKLLGSISAMVLPRGPKGQKPSLWERFRPSFRPRVQISKVKLLGPILAMVPPSDRKL